jgi:hypothetical protein
MDVSSSRFGKSRRLTIAEVPAKQGGDHHLSPGSIERGAWAGSNANVFRLWITRITPTPSGTIGRARPEGRIEERVPYVAP